MCACNVTSASSIRHKFTDMHSSRNASNPANRSSEVETSTHSPSLSTSAANLSQQSKATSVPVSDDLLHHQNHQMKQPAPASCGMHAPFQRQGTPASSSMPATQQFTSTPPSSSLSSSAAAEQYVVEEEMTTVKVPMLRPRPALLKVLHLMGGFGETFTMGEIINHVKDYIRERMLYDEQDPRIVHCGRDLLGAALGVDTFTVHDAINLFRKNCTMEPDSCIRVYRHLVTRPVNCQPQATTGSGAASYTTAAQPARTVTSTATSAARSSYYHPAPQQRAPEISIQRTAEAVNTQPGQLQTTYNVSSSSCTHSILNSSQEFSSSLSSTPASSFSSSEPSSSSTSAVIKFRAAQSYITMADSDLDEKSTRQQMTSADSSSDSGITNGCGEERQRPEKTDSRRRRQSTSINVTYDEPDGAAGPWICEVKMETLPGEMAKAEDDTVVVEYDSDAFSVEYEVDSDSDKEAGEIKLTENSSDESSSTLGAAVLVVCAESDVEYLADYSDSDSGTDAELADADKWQCQHCLSKNPPFHRNCAGCWSLRPDWLPSTTKEVPVGTCGQQQDASTQCHHSDVSSSRQSHSQQSKDSLQSSLEQQDASTQCQHSDMSSSRQSHSQQSKDSLQSSLEQKCGRLELDSSPAARDTKVCRKRKLSSSLSTSDSQDGKVNYKMERMQQTNAGMPGECNTDDKIKCVSAPSSKDDSCVVCLTRRKTASMVHGKTGHQACCYRCATRLKRKRKPCPICRRPIQKVIRNFHV